MDYVFTHTQYFAKESEHKRTHTFHGTKQNIFQKFQNYGVWSTGKKVESGLGENQGLRAAEDTSSELCLFTFIFTFFKWNAIHFL